MFICSKFSLLKNHSTLNLPQIWWKKNWRQEYSPESRPHTCSRIPPHLWQGFFIQFSWVPQTPALGNLGFRCSKEFSKVSFGTPSLSVGKGLGFLHQTETCSQRFNVQVSKGLVYPEHGELFPVGGEIIPVCASHLLEPVSNPEKITWRL